MSNASQNLLAFQSRRLAVVMGTNEIASAIAVALNRAGYPTVLSHDSYPPVIRRGMAFHDALYDDFVELGGVVGRRAESLLEIASVTARRKSVAVTPLSLTDLLALRRTDVLVDARMQKSRITPDFRGLARVTVGLGPKFVVGENCDIAVETRPDRVGGLIRKGATEEADGVSRLLGGVGRERFVYSGRSGVWRTPVDIGMWVPKGFLIGRHEDVAVFAPMDGFLRGVARDSTFAPEGVKLVEIDPRTRAEGFKDADERCRVIASATMKAVKIETARREALAETAVGERR
ncbi:xanthine dehydrogenase [Rhodoblastus acidophilus]|uniref:Xanthine dehydrogenase n=1 Tax=Candidatus Rhodoblastus alkanivorans TaxID=2954117 RepID=A0ABS9Z780_9HYPH|nr:xanthine dehydrogenase [Candidatus Rhodoblastus alkanivorans]MCI4678632.1 xanthine dehydrogenase [Candidatus Rhodoblastus alkanivorans]MCI4683042.1 xanthine dehydrogenase [Candidatus Rhodoblastus alkanivorans]MDI4640352.1 xanthine dehydrogenase [Rhodoblastus acidophilus]